MDPLTPPPRDTLEVLELLEGHWERRNKRDAAALRLVDRHYSRPARSIGAPQLGPPGRLLVFVTPDERALWVSSHTAHPLDKLDAWRCTVFRNEGPALSSELIGAAMRATAAIWDDDPADGWLTFVDTAKVRSTNPGYCFTQAGWWRDPTFTADRRRPTFVRLRAHGPTR